MKCTKISLFATTSIAMLSYIHSAEKVSTDDIWDSLRAKHQPLPIYGNLSEIETREVISQGLAAIEGELFKHASGAGFPEAFKEFYREVGHLGLRKCILSPKGGLKSSLYQSICKGGISLPWIVFVDNGGDYFAINYQDGSVARFIIIPKVVQHDTYTNIQEWMSINLKR